MPPVAAAPFDTPLDTPSGAPLRRPTLWVPKRVLVTRSAAEQPHTAEVVRRCEAAGVTDQAAQGAELAVALVVVPAHEAERRDQHQQADGERPHPGAGDVRLDARPEGDEEEPAGRLLEAMPTADVDGSE